MDEDTDNNDKYLTEFNQSFDDFGRPTVRFENVSSFSELRRLCRGLKPTPYVQIVRHDYEPIIDSYPISSSKPGRKVNTKHSRFKIYYHKLVNKLRYYKTWLTGGFKPVSNIATRKTGISRAEKIELNRNINLFEKIQNEREFSKGRSS